MQFNKIALAALATVAFVGQANALTATAPRYLTGASATALNVTRALQALCVDAGATNKLKLFTKDGNLTKTGNFFTVQCQNAAGTATVKFAGVNADTVAINVDGGSFTAVDNSTTGGNAATFVTPTATTFSTGTGNLAFLGAGVAVVTTTESKVSEGGFMDVEPAAFGGLVDAYGDLSGNFTNASFYQGFGVAVSKGLFSALQSAQGITVTTGAADLLPANQPTISRAQYASIVTGLENQPKTDVKAFFNLANAGKLTLCRRVATSGTQAASNQYFLNTLTGNGPNFGAGTPADVGYTETAAFKVVENATSGNARTCLGSATAYNIGVLSLENAPAATDTYRFVKLGRVEGADGVLNKATILSGEYDFVFNSFKFSAAGNGNSDLIEAIDAKLGADLGANAGLVGTEYTFSRQGNNANVLSK
jgi:hypothetical protein